MKKLLVVLSVLLISVNLLAVQKTSSNPPKESEHFVLEANQWSLSITNYGPFGHNNGEPGGEWPAGSGHYYIYGAGIWIGGINENGDTLTAVGFNPSNGQSELVPGTIGESFTGTEIEDRIYKSGDEDWPISDNNGNPSYVSGFDTYCEFNDNNELGIDIAQTTYTWNFPSNEDIVFIKYQIRANNDVNDLYFSTVYDPDIGQASDDMAAFDINNNIAYAYNADPYDADFGNDITGLFGVKHYYNSEEKDISSFTIFTLQGNPANDIERYNLMAGLDPDGNPRPYGPYDYDSVPGDKKILVCSGPNTLSANDEIEFITAIIAGEGTTGREEIEYPTGDIVEVPTSECLSDLFINSETADEMVAEDFPVVEPAPPISPSFFLTSENEGAKVKIQWNDYPEEYEDPFYNYTYNPESPYYDPEYIRYDFQGYNVYKRFEEETEWTKIATFDKIDGITVIIDTIDNEEIILQEGTDSGLQYELVDTDIEVNQVYQYAVVSYDYQLNTPKSLESIKVPKEIIGGEIISDDFIESTFYGFDGTTAAARLYIVEETEYAEHHYKVIIDSLNGELVWTLTDVTDDTVLIENNSYFADYDNIDFDFNFEVINGLMLRIAYTEKGIRAITELDSDGNIYDEDLWGDFNNYGRSQQWPVFFICESQDDAFDINRIDRFGYMAPYDYEIIFVDESEASLAWEYYSDSCVNEDGEPFYVPFQVYRTDREGNRMRIPAGFFDDNGNGVWDRHRDTPFTQGSGWERLYIYDYVEYNPDNNAAYIENETSYDLPEPFGWGMNPDRPYPAVNRLTFGMYVDLDGYAEAAGLELDSLGYFIDHPHAGEHIKIFTYKGLQSGDYFLFNYTGVEENGIQAYLSCYPNPFNPTLTIDFNIAEAGSNAEVSIYNVRGQLVKTIYKNSSAEKGVKNIIWDGTNVNGSRAASGVYFVKLKQNSNVETKKVLMLK